MAWAIDSFLSPKSLWVELFRLVITLELDPKQALMNIVREYIAHGLDRFLISESIHAGEFVF